MAVHVECPFLMMRLSVSVQLSYKERRQPVDQKTSNEDIRGEGQSISGLFGCWGCYRSSFTF